MQKKISLVSLHPIGEAQWSLCATCGAWLSLQLFEHILYTDIHTDKSQQILNNELIPTLRGVAQFFMEYVHVEVLQNENNENNNKNSENSSKLYVVHTGPTTSPENSYTIMNTNGEIGWLLVNLRVSLL